MTNPTELTYPEKLVYWILEREYVRRMKEGNYKKPWSKDPVFQETYFCNVNRERDPGTIWLRDYLRMDFIPQFQLEMNTILARFINWPPTLDKICPWYFEGEPTFTYLEQRLDELSKLGKTWGGAYVITTHGLPMGKAAYLCRNVLPAASTMLGSHAWHAALVGCAPAAAALQGVEGIGSFISGQIVADLKNTVGHPLYTAPDKATFAVPGPGSARGMSWFFHGNEQYASRYTRLDVFTEGLRKVMNYAIPKIAPIIVDCQDMQNALCEFSKYCRVASGTGRSKRKYPGKA